MQLARLARTVRHLRWEQVAWRLWYRLRRARPDTRPAPPPRQRTGEWRAPVIRQPAMLGPEAFRFLNETGTVAGAGDWNDPARAKLWLYNLHYFGDLNAEGATERVRWHRAIVDRWVRENPPGTGNGWEPYPTSLRIVNWVKWALGGEPLAQACIDSLAIQARWLERHLEYHLLGNHLLANGKALLFAGLFFEGDEARRWLRRGRHILEREVAEQVLPDGGHFERSPMYHAIVLEDLLDVVNVHHAYGRAAPAAWERVAERMLGWLSAMTHPDGEIAFFNDAATGVAARPNALRVYGERLGLVSGATAGRLIPLPDSGYVRLSAGGAVCLADVAPVGPDYLPGHAHADTLSFELSVGGRRLLVNSGTSVYGSGPERSRQRGTAAHNTVTVDGTDSSEVWSGFRVARRARPFDVRHGLEGETVWLRGAHDGYLRLPRKLVHRRIWRLRPGELTVRDELDGRFGVASARFHLHPDVMVAATDGSSCWLRDAAGREIGFAADGGTLRVEPSTYHPGFGVSVPSRCLVVDFERPRCECRLTW